MNPSSFKKLPPLHALAAFEAVARLHSFSKAAEELCVTHGAVSHRIKLLEDHFATSFFVRQSRTVTITAKGTYFLGAVLDALSTLQKASARLSERTQKIVRVSVGPSFARNWLIQRLGDFYRIHPEIDIEISATKLSKQGKLDSIKHGDSDIEVRYGIADEWNDFGHIKLMAGRLYPVCSPAYRKTLAESIAPQSLLRATLLRLPHEPWKPWFEAAGLASEEPIHGPLFSDAGLMLDAAAKGQGVALARSVLADDDLLSGRLVKVSDVSISSPSAYYAIFAAKRRQRIEVKVFSDWLVECCRSASVSTLPNKRRPR